MRGAISFPLIRYSKRIYALLHRSCQARVAANRTRRAEPRPLGERSCAAKIHTSTHTYATHSLSCRVCQDPLRTNRPYHTRGCAAGGSWHCWCWVLRAGEHSVCCCWPPSLACRFSDHEGAPTFDERRCLQTKHRVYMPSLQCRTCATVSSTRGICITTTRYGNEGHTHAPTHRKDGESHTRTHTLVDKSPAARGCR